MIFKGHQLHHSRRPASEGVYILLDNVDRFPDLMNTKEHPNYWDAWRSGKSLRRKAAFPRLLL